MMRYLSAAFICLFLISAASSQVEDEGKQALRMMAEAYKNAKTIEYEASITYQEFKNGRLTPTQLKAKVAIQKPNLVHLTVSNQAAPDERWIMVCDGKTLWQHDFKNNHYQKSAVPDDPMNIQGTLGMLRLLYVQAFFAPDPHAALTKGAKSIAYGSKEKLDGEWCVIAERVLTNQRWNKIWISMLDHLPRRSSTFQVMGEDDVEIYREERTKVRLDAKIPGGLFSFNPPKDAVEIIPEPIKENR